MPKRRKARYPQMPTCVLCNVKTTTLKLHNFCSCICESSHYKSEIRIMNGQEVRDLVLDRSKFPELKAIYMQKINPSKAATIKEEVTHRIMVKKNKSVRASREEKQIFYASWEWKKLRYAMLLKFGPVCMLCGANNREAKICVDHIIPLSRDWNKRLKKDNLQILCNECNMGKSNDDTTDFRSEEVIAAPL